MKKLGFLTCAAEPLLVPEERASFPWLRKRGIEGVPLVWDSDTWNVGDFDAFVVRSCWDYHLKAPRFISFLNSLVASGARVANSAETCLWNLDKHYLFELRDQGVLIPDSIMLEPGGNESLRDVLETFAIEEAVVKPAISLSAYQTWRTRPAIAAEHQNRLDTMRTGGAVLIQRFEPKIQSCGEVSLIFLASELSHSVLKIPKSGDFRTQHDHGATQEEHHPEDQLVDTARRILSLMDEQPLYARVDLVPSDAGPLLMELELIDPSLFLSLHPKGPQKWAQVVADHFWPTNEHSPST